MAVYPVAHRMAEFAIDTRRFSTGTGDGVVMGWSCLEALLQCFQKRGQLVELGFPHALDGLLQVAAQAESDGLDASLSGGGELDVESAAVAGYGEAPYQPRCFESVEPRGEGSGADRQLPGQLCGRQDVCGVVAGEGVEDGVVGAVDAVALVDGVRPGVQRRVEQVQAPE
jgi:hypothetical protein